MVATAAPLLLGPPQQGYGVGMRSRCDDVSEFIRSSFRSVWSLEVLLLLKGSEGPRSEEEIVEALRASHLIVSQSLDGLSAAGLVSIDERGCAAYRPATQGASRAVDAVEILYGRAPDAVRRLIVGPSAVGLAAFADAFRLRKD